MDPVAAAGPSSRPDSPLVGRDRELSVLRAAVEDLTLGRGAVMLAIGEPGIGKTRLGDETSEIARAAGATTLWGRCWEGEGAPPYWPWIQLLRSLLELGPDITDRIDGNAARWLAAIIPEGKDRLGLTGEPPSIESDRDRFALSDAVSAILRRAAIDRPLLLVLDDLHAADHPSLLLLRLLAREIRSSRVLIYGTYRATEAGLRPEIHKELAELGRDATTLLLSGLNENDIRAFALGVEDLSLDSMLVSSIFETTEGNPFFVSQLFHLLASEGSAGLRPEGGEPLPIPDSVRQAIRRRLELLPDASIDVLAAASIMDRGFDLDLIAEGIERDPADVAPMLEAGVAGGIILRSPERRDHYRFAHALIKTTLHDDLPRQEKARLHLRMAELLEREHGSDPDQHVAELAHHFYEAFPLGDRDRALRYARQAARRADEVFANHEAARWYRRALEILEQPPADQAISGEVLLALGNALNRGGDVPAARKVFLRASELARTSGDPELLARAAVGFGRETWTTGVVDHQLVELLEEALLTLPAEDSELRVNVLTRLLIELMYSPDAGRRRELARECLERAERIGKPETLCYAYEAQAFAAAGPDTIERWADVGSEVIRLAGLAGRRDYEASGHIWRLASFLARHDLVGFDREMETYRALVEELEEPNHEWYAAVLRAARALLTGSLTEAEDMIGVAYEVGSKVRREEAALYHAVHGFVLATHRGTPSSLENSLTTFNELADRYPAMPVFRAVEAHLYASLDRPTEARDSIARLAPGHFDAIPKNVDWLAAMGLLAEVAGTINDADVASVIHDLLLPYVRQGIVLDWSIVCLGSVARYLGIAAATMGQLDRAIAHLESGIDADARMGARPYVAHGRLALARTLSLRDQPGDRERAQRLSAQALDAYRELAMERHAEQAELLQGELGGLPVGARPVSGPHGRLAVFRKDGDYWSLSYEGDAFRLKDAKGLAYLARMLAEPGREFHALDLFTASAAGAAPGREDDLAVSTGETMGPALDPQAKAAYKRRLQELDEEMEEAEAANDPERASKARQEREFLASEIAAAVGLGGRDRPTGSAAERARVNVTKAVRTAIGRIRPHSEALAQHLDRTIHTGTFCSYQPDPRAQVGWRVST